MTSEGLSEIFRRCTYDSDLKTLRHLVYELSCSQSLNQFNSVLFTKSQQQSAPVTLYRKVAPQFSLSQN